MSKMKLQQILDYEGITKITIENNMAPLFIEASPHGKVEISGQLDLVQPYEDFTWEDCVTVTCKDGNLKIELDEVEGLEPRYLGSNRSAMKIMVPGDLVLALELENLPITITGITNTLEVTSENAPIRIQDCSGDKKLSNENGPISIKNCEGNLTIELENGPLSAENISGQSLTIESENGPIKIREACFSKVNIENENGVIFYETLMIEDGEINLTNENGVIHLVLPDDLDFELVAETELGHIKSSMSLPLNQNEEQYVMTNGEGRTKILIKTENGMIKIGAGERINLAFLKAKIEQLKESMSQVANSDDLEKVKKLYANVNDYVTSRLAMINEESIKDTIKDNLAKLKQTVEGFDFKGTKEQTIANIEEHSHKIYDEMHKHFDKLHSKIQEGFHKGKQKQGLNIEGLGDYINKVINSPLIKPYLGGELKDNEKEDIGDRSRLKILEMLESGKITSEEAERLLKAISKE